MAAVSATQTTTNTLTPPDSSYGQEPSWGQMEDDQAQSSFGQNHHDFKFPMNSDHPYTNQPDTQTNNNYMLGAQMATRRMKSADDLSNSRWDDTSAENGKLLPQFSPEPKENGQASGSADNGQVWEEKRAADDSKWIHRDKLAKIESQELQAAGLVVPRSRAPSKQRRDRSRSTMRPGTDTSEYSRSRKSSSVDHHPPEMAIPSWDLRTPEEIAEEEANNYFTTNGLQGGSKIPVAKTSPLPISLDYLERGSTGRKNSESPEGDLTTIKTRSRSASASLRGLEKQQTGSTTATGGGKRSTNDASPKKNAGNRKVSNGNRSSVVGGRPKTRSGSISGTRPSTRSGESPPKHPEGDPPWIVNSYQPDPRLPPDQQVLPTVARRLQQEKWEKEGTYGDVYDKDFRPLNDKALLKPPELDRLAEPETETNHEEQQNDGQWPLRQAEAPPTRTTRPRQNSYSTMPKISAEKSPSIRSPTSPLGVSTQVQAQNQHAVGSQSHQRVPEEKEEAKKGCGCCVVM